MGKNGIAKSQSTYSDYSEWVERVTTADENLETPLCVLSVSCFAMLKIWFELREMVDFLEH